MPFDQAGFVEAPIVKPWVPDPRIAILDAAITKLDHGRGWCRRSEHQYRLVCDEAGYRQHHQYCLIGAVRDSGTIPVITWLHTFTVDAILFSPMFMVPAAMAINDVLGYHFGALPILYGARMRLRLTDWLARRIRGR